MVKKCIKIEKKPGLVYQGGVENTWDHFLCHKNLKWNNVYLSCFQTQEIQAFIFVFLNNSWSNRYLLTLFSGFETIVLSWSCFFQNGGHFLSGWTPMLGEKNTPIHFASQPDWSRFILQEEKVPYHFSNYNAPAYFDAHDPCTSWSGK